MKVLLLNTYTHGGAAVACRRLENALQEDGVSVKLLHAGETGNRWPFYAERLSFLPYERDKSVRFSFSPANFGKNLSRHPWVQEADVLHLHWINQGFLSVEGIRELIDLGKPIVWTLHDMWAFTGGCHYSGDCTHFQQSCGNCPYLGKPSPTDLSHRVWVRKQKAYSPTLRIVTCSEWLANVARSSSLLKDMQISSIPNPIDTTVFQPVTNEEKRNFWLSKNLNPDIPKLLFVAMNVGEERKGFRFLQEALQKLRAQHADLQLDIVVMGKVQEEALATLPYPVHALGMIRDQQELARIYGASDLFVIPSLEDNLPNTVMESLACGTPVAGFATGGIPEMVGHRQQGFIAPQADSKTLAEGIYWILRQADLPLLRRQSREKVEVQYANTIVAKRYLQVYEDMLVMNANASGKAAKK
ncbi:MAG TPA: glycosyltransferase family 4 protein [Saprospiraceae bacterium]|nr:glycosyltransferase family 4 protein [Saprospiraceae bacterium]HPI08185.1 glycosyltransferase family 4 protein [Saprospiraceae bacterium]